MYKNLYCQLIRRNEPLLSVRPVSLTARRRILQLSVVYEFLGSARARLDYALERYRIPERE